MYESGDFVRLTEALDASKAVLIVSAELDEVPLLSDRIAGMYEDRFMDIADPEASEERLGILMPSGHEWN